jgi:hypothetical protein
MAKESAEEKLLKMMQKPASSAGAKPSTASSPQKKVKVTFTVATLNTILFLGILGCIAALVLEMRSGFALLGQQIEFPTESRTTSLSDIALPSTRSADFYLREINERNIFRPYAPKVAAKNVQGFAQRMSKYKIVGIAWLDLPETATIMLEDTQKHETFFLKKGEQLEGGVTVKTIYTDRAVFSHENEETTIKL